MSTFNKIEEVKDYAVYKARIKTALGKLRKETKTPFLYVEKFAFKDKERPMLLVDHVKDLVAANTATGSGKCSLNEKEEFHFDLEKGKAPLAKLQRVLADAGVPGEVADPDAKKEAEPAAKEADTPVLDKLKMKHGWTEMASWGAEAKTLIAKFNELVALFKELPEIPPGREDLQGRLVQLKKDMAELVKSEIENDAAIRAAHQRLVEKRIGEVQALAVDIRKKPVAVVQPAQPTKPVATAQAKPQAQTPAKVEPQAEAAEDPQLKRQREEAAAEKLRQQTERVLTLRKVIDEALDTLDTEQAGYDALGKRLTAIADKAPKDKAGQALKAEVAALEKLITAAIVKNLGTSGMGKFAPTTAGFAAYKAALTGAREKITCEARDVAKAQERLDVVAQLRSDFESSATDLDPAVRAKRASPTARKVKGYIWRGAYDDANVKGTLKDIVGIIGQERRGRSSPDGNSNHVHVGGNAQYNVLFHEVGEAVRVLGFVNGHMDKRMPPSVRSEAARVEERAGAGNGDYFEVEVDLSARTLVKVGAT